MSRFITLVFIGILLIGIVGCSVNQPKDLPDHVGFSVLLERMTNVNTFAEAPWGNSFLISSYDKTGGNQDWAIFNKAGPHGRITIFDTEGPGYISRIWIASFSAKRWFFFFDGEQDARLVLTQKELFGNRFPFVPSLAGNSGGGKYSLLPIPFSKSLRIEIEPTNLKTSNRNYFQINYTRLDLKPDAVQSFPRELSVAESNLVVNVNAALETKREALKSIVEAALREPESKTLAPGESLEFWQDEGAGLLASFCIRIDDPPPAGAMSADFLRSLRLQMYWDGSAEPSVDVPLGDFFCNPYYFRSYTSLPLGLVDGTFVCRFPMPYQRGARCVLKNISKTPVSISAGALGNRDGTGGLSRKFHAVWRASKTSGRPLPIMEASGSGHYVGCFLSAIGQDGSWTILEGDEYLKPDPGEQPPQLGTGLEDYFNGAYYYTSLFDLPFHGLIEKGAMRTDQYRLHMLEAVPFNKSFEAGIEFGDRNRAKGYMSSVAYWYADKAAAVPLSSSYSHLLGRPGDRFELPGLMSQFFLLERGGLHADAAERMEFFAYRYRSQKWCDLLKVRAVGYREKVDGFGAVKADYETLAKSPFPPAGQAAADQLWLHEDPTHALLGIHALSKYTLKLDGAVVAQGEGKGELKVHRVQLEKGEHVWESDLLPTRQGSFFSICLRSAFGDLTSAGDWEILEQVPQPGKTSPEKYAGRQVLPNMTVWAFEPNAYVDMQSPVIGIVLWKFYESIPLAKRIKLRKEFMFGTDGASPLSSEEGERSAAELRTHAID